MKRDDIVKGFLAQQRNQALDFGAELRADYEMVRADLESANAKIADLEGRLAKYEVVSEPVSEPPSEAGAS